MKMENLLLLRPISYVQKLRWRKCHCMSLPEFCLWWIRNAAIKVIERLMIKKKGSFLMVWALPRNSMKSIWHLPNTPFSCSIKVRGLRLNIIVLILLKSLRRYGTNRRSITQKYLQTSLNGSWKLKQRPVRVRYSLENMVFIQQI